MYSPTLESIALIGYDSHLGMHNLMVQYDNPAIKQMDVIVVYLNIVSVLDSAHSSLVWKILS